MIPRKRASFATAILASLWYSKDSDVKDIKSHPYLKVLCSEKSPITCRSIIARLTKKGIIKKIDSRLKLTEKGLAESLFAFIDAETSLFKNNFFQKWDEAWRVVFFDIPESKRRYRDFLRVTLKRVGFREIQRSIWAFPYPVPPFLKELIFSSFIKDHVRFITTDSFDNDKDIRKKFNLG